MLVSITLTLTTDYIIILNVVEEINMKDRKSFKNNQYSGAQSSGFWFGGRKIFKANNFSSKKVDHFFSV